MSAPTNKPAFADKKLSRNDTLSNRDNKSVETSNKVSITEIPEDILQLLKEAPKTTLKAEEEYAELEKYMLGDHFQDGKGWIGPVVTTDKLIDELDRGFVADGLIRQAVQRYVLAVVGRSPEVRAELRRKLKTEVVEDDLGNKSAKLEQPSSEERALLDEVEEAITNLWNDRPEIRRHVVKVAQRAALHNTGFGRVYPPDDIDEYVDVNDLTEVLYLFETHSPENYEAKVLKNVHGRVKACYYRTDEGYILSWVDKTSGYTVVAEVDESFQIVDAATYALSQKLPVYEVGNVGIIFPNVVSQQKLVDYDTNMLKFNNRTGSFRQQLMFNAQEPVKIEKDPNTGEEIEVPVPLEQGVGVVNWVAGLPSEDPLTGDTKSYATPSVVWKDPIEQTGLINSIQHNVRRFFENVYQAHVLISSDATASGTSRQQAVQDHIMSLEQLQQEMEAYIRWLMEIILKWAANIMGEEGKYDNLKIVATCQVTAVQLTTEERAAVVAEYNAGLRSREGTMALLGITDVDAEIARIEEEKRKESQAQAPQTDANQPFGAKQPTNTNQLLNGKQQQQDPAATKQANAPQNSEQKPNVFSKP